MAPPRLGQQKMTAAKICRATPHLKRDEAKEIAQHRRRAQAEWGDSSLEHHCPVCAKLLSSSKARSCVGAHVETCDNFHKSLHLIGTASRCRTCNVEWNVHLKRHRVILEHVQETWGPDIKSRKSHCQPRGHHNLTLDDVQTILHPDAIDSLQIPDITDEAFTFMLRQLMQHMASASSKFVSCATQLEVAVRDDLNAETLRIEMAIVRRNAYLSWINDRSRKELDLQDHYTALPNMDLNPVCQPASTSRRTQPQTLLTSSDRSVVTEIAQTMIKHKHDRSRPNPRTRETSCLPGEKACTAAIRVVEPKPLGFVGISAREQTEERPRADSPMEVCAETKLTSPVQACEEPNSTSRQKACKEFDDHSPQRTREKAKVSQPTQACEVPKVNATGGYTELPSNQPIHKPTPCAIPSTPKLAAVAVNEASSSPELSSSQKKNRARKARQRAKLEKLKEYAKLQRNIDGELRKKHVDMKDSEFMDWSPRVAVARLSMFHIGDEIIFDMHGSTFMALPYAMLRLMVLVSADRATREDSHFYTVITALVGHVFLHIGDEEQHKWLSRSPDACELAATGLMAYDHWTRLQIQVPIVDMQERCKTLYLKCNSTAQKVLPAMLYLQNVWDCRGPMVAEQRRVLLLLGLIELHTVSQDAWAATIAITANSISGDRYSMHMEIQRELNLFWDAFEAQFGRPGASNAERRKEVREVANQLSKWLRVDRPVQQPPLLECAMDLARKTWAGGQA